MSATQPSVSLYVSNLNYSQVPKEGASDLLLSSPQTTTAATTAHDSDRRPLAEIRRALYGLFATYGKVLDVVHVRSPKTRGTAFVVFRDLASSTAAMRGLDGESFYGKSLVSGLSRPFALSEAWHLDPDPWTPDFPPPVCSSCSGSPTRNRLRTLPSLKLKDPKPFTLSSSGSGTPTTRARRAR